MDFKKFRQLQPNISFWLLCLIAFTIPFSRPVPVFMILLIINWISNPYNLKDYFKKIDLTHIIFIGLYILFVIGMWNTDNIDSGWFDLQVKLPMILFPLIFVTLSINRLQFNRVLLSFILGNAAAAIACLSYAFYDLFVNKDGHFFYGQLSLFLHTSYFAMYLNFCLVILFMPVWPSGFDLGISKRLRVLFIFFFSIMIFLLSSKAGFILFIILCAVVIFSQVIKTKKYIQGITVLLILGTSLFLLVKYIPSVGNRFKTMNEVFYNKKIDKSSSESNSIRIFVWQEDRKLIKENFWTGVGSGDVKDELLKKYLQDSISGAYKLDPATQKPTAVLNAHGQFFQTFIAIGIWGFILLVVSLVYPLIGSFVRHNYLYGIFLLLIILNFSVESMLETQAGVLFYTFFNSLLYKANDGIA